MICKTCQQGKPIEKFGIKKNGKPHGRVCSSCRAKKATELMRSGERSRPKRPEGYWCWESMIARCYYRRHIGYQRYGGAGVSVCDEWRGAGGFQRFMDHIGPRPSKLHTIDRFPNSSGNYEPGNVRWATMKELCNNKKTNRRLTLNGRTMTMSQWAEEIGITIYALYERIKRGRMTVEEALTFQSPLIEYDGKKLTATEWEKIVGIKRNTISKRIKDGWTPEKALTTPVRDWGRTRK